jgi:hypothetical protein
MNFDWSAINTALIIGAVAYLYRQARIVDQVRQSLTGMDGKGGVLDEITRLRERSHDLANHMAALVTTVESFTDELREYRTTLTPPRRKS